MVSENAPDPNYSEFVDMRLLRAPRTYICRLYVVKGLHLQAKDTNGYADPYLRFKVEVASGADLVSFYTFCGTLVIRRLK